MLLEVDGKKTYMINITNMNKNQNSNNNNSKSIKNDKKNIYNKIHKLKKKFDSLFKPPTLQPW